MSDLTADGGGTPPVPRPMRFTAWSMVRAVAMLGATLGILSVFQASSRVIGWAIAASVAAAIVAPAVSGLARHMPRPVAVLAVMATLLGSVGLIGWGLVDDLGREADRLEEAAPDAARRIEESERFGEAARDFGLAARVESLVDQLPAQLTGGTGADAVRSAATRGLAFLASGVLMLFLVSHGPRLVRGLIDQFPAGPRRDRFDLALQAGYRRAWRYVVGSLAKALVAGIAVWAAARLLDMPGPRLLALWAGVWDVVPYVGAVLGVAPLVLLAAADSFTEAGVVLAVFVAYEIGESVWIQPRLERWSMHVGPAATVIPAMIGFEVYGVGGLLVAIAVTVMVVAVLDELSPGRTPGGTPSEGETA